MFFKFVEKLKLRREAAGFKISGPGHFCISTFHGVCALLQNDFENNSRVLFSGHFFQRYAPFITVALRLDFET